jgi:hypothetical protein
MTPRPAVQRPRCPRCGAPVDRIRRHWLDRLVSVVTPVRRYRCVAFACDWEGTLQDRRHALPSSDDKKRYDRRIDTP